MRPPVAFHCFVAFWGLSGYQRRALWRGLERSRWTAPTAWRQALLAYNSPDRAQAKTLVHEVSSPQGVLGVIEALRAEKQLGRGDAIRIEEAILRAVAADGTWRDHRNTIHPY
jgi:hypothetical protein